MCGIVGYLGPRQASDVLLGGLARLEYRGYDSAGIAIHSEDGIVIARKVGKLNNLAEAIGASPLAGTVGIGHTRWATHGRPSEENAHPHADCTGKVVVVHNGIIENYLELREELAATGHVLRSETDTETVAHLVESYYEGDLAEAVERTVRRLHGSYALAVMHADEPDTIVAARKDSPLIIGEGEGETIVASDIPAVLEYTREVLVLEDGDVARVTPDGVVVHGEDGLEREPERMHVEWDLDAAEKGGYDTFMLKEINEQPKAIRETLRGRFDGDGTIQLSELAMSEAEIAAVERMFIVACGTSYHAGIVAKNLIETWARIPVPRETVQATFTEDALSQLREYHKFEKMAGWSNLTEDEFIGWAAEEQVRRWMDTVNTAVEVNKNKNVKKIIERDKKKGSI
jgi:glucosamine--fructose-6-phosphate aminotransferase (isomerizing)